MIAKKLAAASMTALLLSSTALVAQTSNDAVNEAIAEMQGAGFTHIEVRIRNGSFKVEGIGPDGSLEQIFDTDGNLIREERVENGIETETTYDAEGNVISMETGPAEDDGDDDDHDDDHDEDHDDDDHDEDHDDDDDDDDDDDHGGDDDDDDDDDDESDDD